MDSQATGTGIAGYLSIVNRGGKKLAGEKSRSGNRERVPFLDLSFESEAPDDSAEGKDASPIRLGLIWVIMELGLVSGHVARAHWMRERFKEVTIDLEGAVADAKLVLMEVKVAKLQILKGPSARALVPGEWRGLVRVGLQGEKTEYVAMSGKESSTASYVRKAGKAS